jgi:hypothetical protein
MLLQKIYGLRQCSLLPLKLATIIKVQIQFLVTVINTRYCAQSAFVKIMGSVTTEAIARQPDIDYAPNFQKYQARTKFRLQTEPLDLKSLPSGFPKRLESDLIWEGEGLAEKYDWTHVLTPEQVQELENALTHFKSLNKPLGYISQETFPLPNLHAILRDLSRELHFGHGFKVVRGIPVERHTREDNIILYAGLSSHIAPLRGRQDSQHNGKLADVVLNHIKDLSSTTEKAHIGAPAYTADKQVVPY